MPMLGQCRHISNPTYKNTKKQKDAEIVAPPEFIVKETNEICSNKEEHDRKLYIYARPIWSCKITGKTGLTFAQAKKSETAALKVVNDSYTDVIRKHLLENIHTSELSLDPIIDKCYRLVNQQYWVGEKIKYLLKAPTENKLLEAIIISRTEIPEEKSEILNHSADGSDKENASVVKKISQRQDLRYDLQLVGNDDETESFIKNVSPDLMSRPVKVYQKELIKHFIRAHSGKYMPNSGGPWIVDAHLLRKFKIPTKAEYEIDKDKLFGAYKTAEMEMYEKCLDHEKNGVKDGSEALKWNKLKPRNSVSLFKRSPPKSPTKAQKRLSLQQTKESATKTKWKQSSLLQFSPTRSAEAAPEKPKPPAELKTLEQKVESKASLSVIIPLCKKLANLLKPQDLSLVKPELLSYVEMGREMLKATPASNKVQDKFLRQLSLVKPLKPYASILLEREMNNDIFSRLMVIAEFLQTYVCLYTSWESKRVHLTSSVNLYTLSSQWDISINTQEHEADESEYSFTVDEMSPETYTYLTKIGLDLLSDSMASKGLSMFASYYRCFIRVVYGLLMTLIKYTDLTASFLGFKLTKTSFNPYLAVEMLRVYMLAKDCPSNKNKGDLGLPTEESDEESDDNSTENSKDSNEDKKPRGKPKELAKVKPEKNHLIEILTNHDIDQISLQHRIEMLEYLIDEILNTSIVNDSYLQMENELSKIRQKIRTLKQSVAELSKATADYTEDKVEVDSTDKSLSARASLRKIDAEKLKNEKKQRKLVERLESETAAIANLHLKLLQLEQTLHSLNRVSPLGGDRNASKYYYLKCAPDRLLIETTEGETGLANGNEIESVKSNGEMEIDLISEPESTPESQREWKMVNTLDDYKALTDSLCPFGEMESSLLNELSNYQILDKLTNAIKQRDANSLKETQSTKNITRNAVATEEESEKIAFESMVSTLLHNIINTETAIRNSGLGGVETYSDLERRVVKLRQDIKSANFTSLQGEKAEEKLAMVREECLAEVKDLMRTVQEGVNRNFLYVHQTSVRCYNNNSVKCRCGTPDTVRRWLNVWEERLESAKTFSSLNLLLCVFHSAIRWNKSIESSKCLKCNRGHDEENIILCDKCNSAHHIYCLTPALNKIPAGDWFCAKCDPELKYTNSEDIEEDPEILAEKKMRDTCCLVCQVEENTEQESGEEDKFLACLSCPAIYHPMCHQPPVTRTMRNKAWHCSACRDTGIEFMPKFSTLLRRCSTAKQLKQFFEKRRNHYLKLFGLTQNMASERKPARESLRRPRKEESSESESEEPATKRTRSDSLRSQRTQKVPSVKEKLLKMFETISLHRCAWPFLEPVDKKEAPDYYDVILDPIDLSMIKEKINSDTNKSSRSDYTTTAFSADIAKMFYNAELYNSVDSEVITASKKLERFIQALLSNQDPPIPYSREKLN